MIKLAIALALFASPAFATAAPPLARELMQTVAARLQSLAATGRVSRASAADLEFIVRRLSAMNALIRNVNLRSKFRAEFVTHLSPEDLAWWLEHQDAVLAHAGERLSAFDRRLFADFKTALDPADYPGIL